MNPSSNLHYMKMAEALWNSFLWMISLKAGVMQADIKIQISDPYPSLFFTAIWQEPSDRTFKKSAHLTQKIWI
jgi:hypothetical protein